MFTRFWMILTTVMVLTIPAIGAELKIASWNIEKFGRTKAGLENEDSERYNVIGKIAHIIENMIKNEKIDLIAIQEVQDADYKTLLELLKVLGEEDWEYIESERTGRGTQQEQYAIFFNRKKLVSKIPTKDTKCSDDLEDSKDTKIIYLYDDKSDHFSRDPGYASFCYGDFEFVVIICHLDPKQHAAYEAERLDDVYDAVKRETGSSHIFVVGDFNLEEGPHDIAFRVDGLLKSSNMRAALDENYDTTVGAEHKTFDNILFDSKKFKLENQNVCRFDGRFGKKYDRKISDHYPVWAIFEILVDNE